MADKARELTDARLDDIVKRLKAEYRTAQRELSKKLDAYMARADKRLETLAGALSSAKAKGDAKAIKAAEEALAAAKLNITLNDRRYRELIDDITDRLASANETALQYVNGEMPYIYRQNFNGTKLTAAEVGMDFSVMNEEAVAKRIKEGDIRLPKKKLSVPKDKEWNTKQLNSAVLQGIIQGEPMRKIAKRLLPIVENNRNAAIRNARTMVTGAENEGRLDGFRQLEAEGAVLKKVWIATADSRTREAHLLLDGQEVGTDEPFVDADGNELMYPGDPSAEPGTVYNCRCSMRTHIIGFRKADGRIEPVKYDHKSGMHQEAIEREKEERGVAAEAAPEPKKQIDVPKLQTTLSPEEYEEYMRYVNADPEIQRLNELYGEKLRYVRDSSAGYYSSSTVHWSEDKQTGHSKYSILAHECGHGFDAQLGQQLRAGDIQMDVTFSEVSRLGTRLKSWQERPRELPSASDQFLGALRRDMESLKARYDGEERWRPIIATLDLPNARNSTAGVQDALDGFYNLRGKSGSGIVWGHGATYYNRFWRGVEATSARDAYRLTYGEMGFDVSSWAKVTAISRQYEAASEAWANITSAITCGGEELTAIEKYMPETLAAYRRLIQSIKT